ncbi:Uncharacterised protein [Mycobacteroides abscessus subsp. bolletii]|nr:Uncharacterised protein [Mycobacteroides abscessus subsp. bolletii]SKS85119.1 Uncharacterised protein [Mycobacteroides abscessus subsp. bolletii]
MPMGLRRASALVAIVALAVGGAKVIDDHTVAGSGFSAVATVAAEPTGPPGPTGGMTDGGGSQFQPPQMPSSMPDYQGGNNQPPLDQNSGISIYNTGSPGAQQVPGQQAGQQPQQAQQPAHGTQIPDYQTATPYTQGPGKANPDYQAPQQNSPQQPQQGQQQPSQQQEQQPQNKQDDTTRQLNDQQQQQRQQQCQAAVADMADMADMASQVVNTGVDMAGSGTEMIGGGGRSPIWFFEPGLDPIPADPNCPSCPKDSAQKDSGSQKNNQQQPKDPRDCKNGAASGKCVPDEDVQQDCYVLTKGTSCGKVCESYNLGQFGQCVSRCATISCTEYLNQKTSRALAEWSTRFAADHGGWKALGCGVLGSGAAWGSKAAPNPYVKLIATALAYFAALCTTSGGVNSIQAGVALEAIKNQGGCLALTTYPFSLQSFTRDVSGWCTNG